MRKLAFLCWVLIFALAPAAHAKERPWYKYENKYFEAYSDASEKKVMRLLEELENFRAAVIQLNGGQVPDSAEKTQVVIFNSRKDFKDTIRSDLADAYAVNIGGVSYIVMSAGRISAESLTIIRHEFTHVLQAYGGARLPPWYVEGYAEFMSGMTFREENTEFIIGDYPGRAKVPGALLEWNDLISDDFAFHRISSRSEGSNAYLQSWLLVHYLTLGEQMAHNSDLIRYLTKYGLGIESNVAFQDVFGESANVMGPRIFKQYSKRFYPMVLNFMPGSQDFDFVKKPIDTDRIAEIIVSLKFANIV